MFNVAVVFSVMDRYSLALFVAGICVRSILCVFIIAAGQTLIIVFWFMRVVGDEEVCLQEPANNIMGLLRIEMP